MIRFFERAYPSANSILLMGHRPVLVDTGFGSDAPELPPRRCKWIWGFPAEARMPM
jgi:hypothetical protein